MECDYTLITNGKTKYSLRVRSNKQEYSGIVDFTLYIRNAGSVIKTQVPAITLIYDGIKVADIPYYLKEVTLSEAIDLWNTYVHPLQRNRVIEKEYGKKYADKCKELCSESSDRYDYSFNKDSDIGDVVSKTYDDGFTNGFMQACKLFIGEKLDD